ncbi:MAG: insulinase family protein [Bacteroidales bacterium]|nr:insulinase family protein [Bacteroidales bacterium]
MNKKIVILLALFVAFSGAAMAQFDMGGSKKAAKESDLSAQVPVDRKVKIGKLDNGMTYYIRANKKPENRIQFRLVTNAGSILEDETQLGLAHFCEHMAFNGTQHYPKNELISELQKVGITFGSDINAYTSFDETVYYLDMPNDQKYIEMGIKILDGWASKLLFDPKEIEAERGVIHEEWRLGRGAQDRLQKKTWPILMKDSRYAERLPIGKEEVIMNFKHDEIIRFYRDWYRTDLQAVIIVGDFDAKDMERRVIETFSSYSKPVNPKERTYYNIPDNVEPLIAIATDKECTSTSLMMMWKHKKAPQGTIGDYRNSIVRQLISGMINARFEELCEKSTCPAIYAASDYGGFLGRSTDAFELVAMPKDGRVDEAGRFMLTEMKRIDQYGFLQGELDRQKEAVLDGYRKSAKEVNKTPNVRFADEYTRHFLQGEVIPGIRQEYEYAKEFMEGITLEECNKIVADWITDENMIYYLTANDNSVIPTEADVKKMLVDMKNVKTEPWVDNYKDEPLWTKDLADVTPRVSKKDDVLGYTEYTCPNGIKFIVKKTDYKDDEIIMRSYSLGGASLYGDNEAYAVSLAAGLIDDAGIGQFSSSDLGKKLKGKTLSIEPTISGESQGFSASCSPKDLETTLQLLNLYYMAPRKDQDNFDKNIEAMRTQYKMILENPLYYAISKFYSTAYNNNPRVIFVPTEEQLNSVKLDRVYDVFLERFCDASNQTFFFVGKIDDSDVNTIAKYLNNLPCNGKQKNEMWKDRSVKLAAGVNRVTAYKGSDEQGYVFMLGETDNFPTDMKSRVVCDALGEALQITTTEVIREKMGSSYSPAAMTQYSILPTSKFTWIFQISCDPTLTDKVEKAAVDILKQYQKKGVDKETLTKVKEQMIKNRETAMQNNGFWMNQIYGSYLYGENRGDVVKNYADYVNSISSKDIKEMAKKYFDLNHYTSCALKPETLKK